MTDGQNRSSARKDCPTYGYFWTHAKHCRRLCRANGAPAGTAALYREIASLDAVEKRVCLERQADLIGVSRYTIYRARDWMVAKHVIQVTAWGYAVTNNWWNNLPEPPKEKRRKVADSNQPESEKVAKSNHLTKQNGRTQQPFEVLEEIGKVAHSNQKGCTQQPINIKGTAPTPTLADYSDNLSRSDNRDVSEMEFAGYPDQVSEQDRFEFWAPLDAYEKDVLRYAREEWAGEGKARR